LSTVTPNFNWPVPTSSDLVKDGATAIEALGDSIDASLVDLKGGTSGQVLSKNSNTDMDFTWVAQDDSNAIQNTQLTAKGALISAFSAGTPATLTVGNNGETLVADSSTSTGLSYQANWAAGKNKIINGDFRVNQRNFVSFNPSNAGVDQYIFDRFFVNNNLVGGGTTTVSPQTFTPGTAPVAGYEGTNFLRCVTSSQANALDYFQFGQKIEDVRTFAGQTVTVSFWAKASTGTPLVGICLTQQFGSGGSSRVITSLGTKTISASWVRYSATVAVPSISGKTIGTGSFLQADIFTSAGSTISGLGFPAVGLQNITADIWGVQVEAGSVATAFQTATGTIQGELSACMRYYYRSNLLGGVSGGAAGSTTQVQTRILYQVPMRTSPTVSLIAGTLQISDDWASDPSTASPTLDGYITNNLGARVQFGGFTGLTQGRFYAPIPGGATTCAIEMSAEL
jgi:hypothetical protein